MRSRRAAATHSPAGRLRTSPGFLPLGMVAYGIVTNSARFWPNLSLSAGIPTGLPKFGQALPFGPNFRGIPSRFPLATRRAAFVPRASRELRARTEASVELPKTRPPAAQVSARAAFAARGEVPAVRLSLAPRCRPLPKQRHERGSSCIGITESRYHNGRKAVEALERQ